MCGVLIVEAEVVVGPIVDWCVVADCEMPFVCIVTAHAWYRLANPSAAYASLFTSVSFKAQLCHCAVRSLRESPGVRLPDLLVSVCQQLMTRWGYQVALLSDVQVLLPPVNSFSSEHDSFCG